MKNIIFFILLSMCFSLNAQTEEKGILISASYYSPYIVQFGAKVGTEFQLKNWVNNKENRSLKTRKLSLRPQIGYFTRPGLHRNFILETDIAYTLKKANRQFYFTPSIGLGYIISIENIEGSVNLGTGEINQEKETRHFFAPTFNLEIGRAPKKYLGYFFKTFVGGKMSGQKANATLFGAELGIKFLFKKSNS